MNKALNFLSIILLIFCFGCHSKEHTISGVIEDMDKEIIYLKKYDHFNYLDEEYILDSCTIDKNRSFKFILKKEYPNFVTLTTYKHPPGTYQVFAETPEHFYYSFCSNFLAETPTFYIEDGKDYIINHWDSDRNLESVVFNDSNANALRDYYKEIDFRKDLRGKDRKPLIVEKEIALSRILKIRDYYLKKYNLDKDFDKNSFKNYFKTEITLGAITEFLQWFPNVPDRRIDDVFFSKLMSVYEEDYFHPSSLEYYKLTEHYISYKLNIKNKCVKIYYPPSDEKLMIAMKYVNDNVKSSYVNNIRQLVK